VSQNRNVKNTEFVSTTWVLSRSECTKTRFQPGLRPRPCSGSLRRSPRPSSRLGTGTPPPYTPFPSTPRQDGISISPPSPSSKRNLRQWLLPLSVSGWSGGVVTAESNLSDSTQQLELTVIVRCRLSLPSHGQCQRHQRFALKDSCCPRLSIIDLLKMNDWCLCIFTYLVILTVFHSCEGMTNQSEEWLITWQGSTELNWSVS